jgi:hypothetical protein
MQMLRFYKEEKKWYIDLPEWTGRKSSLQMVSGADTMLAYMAEGKNEVYVYVSEEEQEDFACLEFISKCCFNGAYYRVDTYNNNYLNLKMWLCNVTKYVLGEFPEKIYFAKARELCNN